MNTTSPILCRTTIYNTRAALLIRGLTLTVDMGSTAQSLTFFPSMFSLAFGMGRGNTLSRLFIIRKRRIPPFSRQLYSRKILLRLARWARWAAQARPLQARAMISFVRTTQRDSVMAGTGRRSDQNMGNLGGTVVVMIEGIHPNDGD